MCTCIRPFTFCIMIFMLSSSALPLLSAPAQSEAGTLGYDGSQEQPHIGSLTMYPVLTALSLAGGEKVGPYLSVEGEIKMLPHFSGNLEFRSVIGAGACLGAGCRVYSEADIQGLFIGAYWDSACLIDLQNGKAYSQREYFFCSVYAGFRRMINKSVHIELAGGLLFVRRNARDDYDDLSFCLPMISFGVGKMF